VEGTTSLFIVRRSKIPGSDLKSAGFVFEPMLKAANDGLKPESVGAGIRNCVGARSPDGAV
jgi:hypothetical protein